MFAQYFVPFNIINIEHKYRIENIELDHIGPILSIKSNHKILVSFQGLIQRFETSAYGINNYMFEFFVFILKNK